jgi:glycosyltransferase involved in cell wall biosynthesis
MILQASLLERFMRMRHMPRVAVFTSSIVGGGTEKSVLWLANGLAEAGFTVDLIVGSDFGDVEPVTSPKVNLLALRKPRTFACLPSLIRYIRRTRPHVIFSALDAANVVSLLSVKLTGADTKTIISARGDPRRVHDLQSFRGVAVGLLRRLLYRSSDAAHAVSEGVAARLAKETGLRTSQISVIVGPVLPPADSLSKSRSASLPEELRAAAPYVLAVGRLVPEKDFETLIFAFSSIVSKIPHHLVIVGEGEEEASLRRLSRELGLADRILFTGFVENVYPYMESAELFVLSSRSEGMPGVLIQALASGLNVVSTDCDFGPREILDGGRWGPLVEVGNPDELARQILEQVSPHRSKRSLLRAQEFSYESSISQFREMIFETLR